MGIARHSRPRRLAEDGGSWWKGHSLEPSPQSKMPLSHHHHLRLSGAGALSEPSPWDSLDCGAGIGWHVGPGMSCGSALAETHIQFPKLGVEHCRWGSGAPTLSESAEQP